jgi:hypothetical protein
MARVSSLYSLADRVSGGKLESEIRTLRGMGHPYAQIATRLYVSHGIQVTPMTVRNWARALGIDS